jgi:hypothetical protein
MDVQFIRGRCYDHNFLRFLPIFCKTIVVFLKKTMFRSNAVHNLVFFWVSNSNFFAKIFLKNRNIGLRLPPQANQWFASLSIFRSSHKKVWIILKTFFAINPLNILFCFYAYTRVKDKFIKYAISFQCLIVLISTKLTQKLGYHFSLLNSLLYRLPWRRGIVVIASA